VFIMDAKYQKYYDALKGVDLSSKSSTVVSGCSNLVNSTKKLDSQISASSWKELGLEQIKSVVIPSFIQAIGILQSNCDVLANACAETNTLVSYLEELQTACTDYENCPSDEEHKDDKSKLQERVKNCESKVDSQISKIKGLEGNVKDIQVTVTASQTQSTDVTNLQGLDAGATNAKGEFVYYCQGDYKNYSYGYGKSIAAAGCGPTSLAMVLTYYTGKKITPVDTAQYAMNHNYRIKNNGTSDKLFGAMCQEYGVKGEYQSATADNIVTALKQGKKIIAHMGPGTFTKGGHYIVLKGITSDGKVQVADPNHPNYNNKTFSASLIAKESKGRMYVAG
jgi:hypothetical protein